MIKIRLFYKSIIMYTFIILAGSSFSGCFGSGSSSSSNEKANWTIMYYVDGDNNLENFLYKDLNEIEGVDFSNKKVQVIALVDRINGYYSGDGNWADTRAYKVGFDSSGFNSTLSSATKRIAIPSLGITKSGSIELNMGHKTTLANFISFCKSSYPAQNYMLLMSNHGGGWRSSDGNKEERIKKIGIRKAICWDDTNWGDSLYMKEVREAIESGFGATDKIDIIALDACLMGMVEVAAELKGVADILIASEETIPGYGFPYTQIMRQVKNHADDITPIEFATFIVDQYYTVYTNGTNVEGSGEIYTDITLSAIDLSRIDTVVTEINNLGSDLDNSITCGDARLLTFSYADPDNADIYGFCDKVIVGNALQTALGNAIIINKSGADFINSQGLALYFPLSASYFNNEYSAANILFAKEAPDWVSFISSHAPTYTDALESIGNNDYDSAYSAASNNGIWDGPNSLLNGAGEAIDSYIYYRNDYDMFFIHSAGNFTIDLAVPAGVDYDMKLYGIDADDEIEQVGESVIWGDDDEQIVQPATADYPGGYLLIVYGYEESYSSVDTYALVRKDN